MYQITDELICARESYPLILNLIVVIILIQQIILLHYCPVNNSILSVSYKRECKQFVNLANKY